MEWNFCQDTGFVVGQVDALLAADKELPGEPPRWQEGHRQIEKRLVWPVLVNGELRGINLNITAYPDDPVYTDQRFTITLNVPPCIWRLDFDPPTRRHRNPLAFGGETGLHTVGGANYHAWSDNRYLATRTRLPTRLPCARPVPAAIRHFGQGLRWFCDQTNIKILHDQMVDYPPREKLL